MNIGILYSGGKDSTHAIELAKKKGWNIKYLLSVKPTRRDCFLFHFATVEHTKELSNILGYKHILINCDVADPKQEANLVKEVVEKNPVDAIVLGGIGLQETQLKSIREALFPLGIEVFASHKGEDHETLMKDLVNRGYEIMITQIASDGMNKWLGEKITKDNFNELKKDSIKYGFHIGFEGGYADTFVVDGPIFNKKFDILNFDKITDSETTGYVEIKNFIIREKEKIVKSFNPQ
tara:strand:- start:59198 stop:59905 length:708 start_codon:yes stop_codon:yes gene_type:complete